MPFSVSPDLSQQETSGSSRPIFCSHGRGIYILDLCLIKNYHEGYLIGRIAVAEVFSVTWSSSMNWYAQNEQKTNVAAAKKDVAR